MNEIESPCIKICRTDSNGICIGCRRTRNEIGDWSKYSNEQKKQVLENTSTRKVATEDSGGFSF